MEAPKPSEPSATPATDNAAPTTAPATPQRTAPVGVSFLTACLIALGFSAASGFMSWHLASRIDHNTNVVFIDSIRLAEISMRQIMNQPDMTPEKAATAGREFSIRLDSALNDYTKAGIVVVNSSVVLNRTPSLDVTPLVAGKLGLSLQGAK